MSNLSQNQNATFQSPMLAQVTIDPQPNVVSAQIDPSSAATVIVAGCNVKLVHKSTKNIVVDVCTSASDGPVFGVIPYNMKKNVYSPGDTVEIVGALGILMLKTSGAVNRGDNVSVTNPSVATNDPTVATDTTTGDYITGVALGQSAGANELIKVKVSPGFISASTAATTAATP